MIILQKSFIEPFAIFSLSRRDLVLRAFLKNGNGHFLRAFFSIDQVIWYRESKAREKKKAIKGRGNNGGKLGKMKKLKALFARSTNEKESKKELSASWLNGKLRNLCFRVTSESFENKQQHFFFFFVRGRKSYFLGNCFPNDYGGVYLLRRKTIGYVFLCTFSWDEFRNFKVLQSRILVRILISTHVIAASVGEAFFLVTELTFHRLTIVFMTSLDTFNTSLMPVKVMKSHRPTISEHDNWKCSIQILIGRMDNEMEQQIHIFRLEKNFRLESLYDVWLVFSRTIVFIHEKVDVEIVGINSFRCIVVFQSFDWSLIGELDFWDVDFFICNNENVPDFEIPKVGV